MKIVLYKPQIPPNTGNIVRTCSVTGSDLHLISPGFQTDDKSLKRAGLDYWEGVNVTISHNLFTFLENAEGPFYFFSSHATKCYSGFTYPKNSLLIFGSEVSGLPKNVHEKWPERFVKLPILSGKRCLNLATSVGIALYEAWRQNEFTFE